MEKKEIQITLLQADTHGETIGSNLAILEELIESTEDQTDIILLPELFNTGYKKAFTTRPETMGMQTHKWMRMMAERKNAAICGSVSIAEGGKTFNRMLFVEPDGKTQHYDKVNVFAFSGEDKVFTAGNQLPIFEFLGWRIKPMICFDLRFPETIRNHNPYYDLILCSAHWPKPRIEAWDKLLMARAIENQTYLAAVNRIGMEGEAIYPGHSAGIDFLGKALVYSEEKNSTSLFKISKAAVNEFRIRFPFLSQTKYS